jgi:hypothetical protein
MLRAIGPLLLTLLLSPWGGALRGQANADRTRNFLGLPPPPDPAAAARGPKI